MPSRYDSPYPHGNPYGRQSRYDPEDDSPYSQAARRGMGRRSARDYLEQPKKGPSMDRRTFLIAATGGVAAAAALGIVGTTWWSHRAVACTVDGSACSVPVGSSVQDLVDRGLANPAAGNLVSIPDENGAVEVLTAGGGEPYTLTVNGEPADPAMWRLAEGDVVQFTNGADVTEEVSLQTTEIPCGIQIPGDQWYLNSIGYVKQWGRLGISTIETGLVSGRTYDRGVTQEPQDLIIERSGVNPSDGRLLVALTFDDGPDLTYTPQYLDILARYGAKATFFNIGSSLDAGPEYTALSKRCADEGHQVASHTYSHGDPLSDLDDATRNQEIQGTFDLVSNATGIPTQVMRPPYGELRGWGFLRYLQQQGDIAYSAFWTIDSSDWEVATKMGLEDGAAQIVANCTAVDGVSVASNPAAYNGAIVLMHDGGGNRDRDVLALPSIIEAFQAAGFQLVTLNEMLASDPTFPEWVHAGYVTRPEGAIVPDASVEVSYLEYGA